MKQFDKWNAVKKKIDQREEIIKFKERDIYWISIGENQKSSALLVQAKIFDVKRIDQKIGMINKNDFLKLKEKLRSLLDL